MDVHECTRVEQTPPAKVEYVGACGYKSEDKKEFRMGQQPISRVTCAGCVKKIGRLDNALIGAAGLLMRRGEQ